MDSNQSEKPIKEEVLRAIGAEGMKMRPRWHFVVLSGLVIFTGFFLFTTTLYLASFIVFTLRESGAWFGPHFGAQGWLLLARSLPWLVVLSALVCIAVLESLVRRYRFAYDRPLLYSLLGIVFLILAGAMLTAPLHARPFRAAREHRLPFAGGFYRNFGAPPLGELHRGEVVTVTEDSFVMEEFGGATSTVLTLGAVRPPLVLEFKEGDTVIVFGPEVDDAIHAFGILKLED